MSAQTLAECVANVSEGRDHDVLSALAAAAEDTLLDLHTDPDHNRSVLTLGGELADVEAAAEAVVAEAVARIDLTSHDGVHPRLGAADVVPFVPLGGPLEAAVSARDRLAGWAGAHLKLPCFLYGPERSLPEIRKGAFKTLAPDTGPPSPHPTAGASAVGARGLLVAYNVWITGAPGPRRRQSGGEPAGDLELARAVAASVRGPAVRALGLPVAGAAQVSCNLVDPLHTGPGLVHDLVARQVEAAGGSVVRAELVGLVPRAVLAGVARHRWAELDLGEDRTIEARLAEKGSST